MVKIFTYKGKTVEELQKMSTKEFSQLVPSRQRRSLLREQSKTKKVLLKKIEKTKEGKQSKPIKTHCRDMIITPNMLGQIILIHRGKEYIQTKILPEMIGKYLGELCLTRKRVQHSAPGVGATKSSGALSVK